MNTQQVTAIALRLLAIWLLIQLVLNLPSLIMLRASVMQYNQQEIPMSVYLLVGGLCISIGLVAVFLINKTAASVLARARSEPGTTLNDDSQKLLFQLAGLYFVVSALSKLPSSLSFIPHTTEIEMTNLLWPAGLVFQLGVGLWLASNSVFWLNLFSKMRGRA